MDILASLLEEPGLLEKSSDWRLRNRSSYTVNETFLHILGEFTIAHSPRKTKSIITGLMDFAP
jgi:hypothetical protein